MLLQQVSAVDRPKFMDRAYELFDELALGIDGDDDERKDAAVISLQNEVRGILQVNELVAIREHLVNKAAKFAQPQTSETR